MSNNSIWPTDSTLLVATTEGYVGPDRDVNEEVAHIS